MNNLKRTFLFALIIICVLFSFNSCLNQSSSNRSVISLDDNKRSFDFSICVSKPEYYEPLTELCKKYEDETGVIIKVINFETATNYLEFLQKELSTEDPPTVFSIDNLYDLEHLKNGSYLFDLSSSNVNEFKELCDDIEANLRLTYNGYGNYGIPCGMEGFGFIIDTEVISALFLEKSVHSFIEDFKNCNYFEFESLIKALDSYINGSTNHTIVLNNNSYKLKSSKNSIVKNLNGIFSISGADVDLFGSYLVNPYLNAIFSSSNKFYNANQNRINLLSNPLKKYSQFLDMVTTYIAGSTSRLERGADFVNGNINGDIDSIKNFSNHKSIFLVGTQNAYNKVDDNLKTHLRFLPIKTSLTEDNIKVDNVELKNLNNSLSIFIPMYYSINNKATNKEKKLAQDFLYWLNVSQLGQLFIKDDLNLLPYNSSEKEFQNPLYEDIYYYKNENEYINKIFNGVNPEWNSSIGQEIINKFLIKASWSDNDYTDIANICINEWKKFN